MYKRQEINGNKKPYAILYGAYDKKHKAEKKNDGICRLVYAGMIDTIQKDAFNAQNLCTFLSNKYSLNIIGKGNKASMDCLLAIIAEHNSTYECKITYDGYYEGEALDTYISQFDIGLNIRACSEGYNLYSFPSKILMYLSYGLQVLTTPISCVKESIIGKSLIISENDHDYEKMAKQLDDVGYGNDSFQLIEELHTSFKLKLQEIC